MRFLLPFVVLAFGLAGCPADLTEVCSLSGAAPENVEAGNGSATLDGAPFDGPATWSPGSSASITIGLLTMIVAKDVTGTEFDQLIADNALPICVPQGDRSDTSGNSALNDSPAFTTDAEHRGNVALLSFKDDVLTGRFQLELVNPDSATDTRTFDDGVFAATRQE